MKEPDRKIIIIHETVRESIITDVFTIVSLTGMTLLGWWVGSDALQWIGGFMVFMAVLIRANARMNRDTCYTIDQARAEIDRIERNFKGERS